MGEREQNVSVVQKNFWTGKNASVGAGFTCIIAEVMTASFRAVCFRGRVLSTTVAVSFVFVAFADVALAQGTPAPITVSYDFRNGAQGWQASFADYPPATDNGFYELKAENLSTITVGAQDEQRGFYDLPVVAVHEVPNSSWINQVTVRLPDQLKGLGGVLLWVSLDGLESNKMIVALQ